MSLDITLHPISEQEFNYYIFSVLNDNSLMQSRINEINNEPEERDHLLLLYKELLKRVNNKTNIAEVGYIIAAIMGYLRPYWYLSNVSFCALTPRAKVIRSILKPIKNITNTPANLLELSDPNSANITKDYTCGGYIFHKKLDVTAKYIEQTMFMSTDEKYVMLHAIRYAKAHSCGLLEVSKVVDLGTNEWCTRIENMRADPMSRANFVGNGQEHDINNYSIPDGQDSLDITKNHTQSNNNNRGTNSYKKYLRKIKNIMVFLICLILIALNYVEISLCESH